MFARLYNVAWSRTGRDRPVLPMATIKNNLDAAGAATSAARIDFRYIKRGVLQLPGVASDQDYRANYLIYSNDDSHYFGAWIDSIDWASAGSFAVNFTDDNFTTFAAGATVQGYRTRGVMELPSGEALGDFRACETDIAFLWGMTLAETYNPIIVYLNVETAAHNFFKPRGIIETPYVPLLLESNADKATFLEMISNTNFDADKIVAAYVVPALMTESVTTARINFPVFLQPDVTLPYITDSGLRTLTIDPFAAIRNTADKILLNSNDAKLTVRLGKSSINVPIESIDVSGSFTVKIALTPYPTIAIVPPWKSDVSLFNSAAAYGYADFPMISFSGSNFAYQQISKAIPSALASFAAGFSAGGLPGAIGMTAGSLIGSAITAQTAIEPPPNVSTGGVNSIDAVRQASVAIELRLPADRTRAVNFYKRFGYPCAHSALIDFAPWTQTAKYDFYQSTDNVITGNMPAAAKDEIDAALKAGVRCWNTIGIGDYT